MIDNVIRPAVIMIAVVIGNDRLSQQVTLRETRQAFQEAYHFMGVVSRENDTRSAVNVHRRIAHVQAEVVVTLCEYQKVSEFFRRWL